jgi:hypothetical protein
MAEISEIERAALTDPVVVAAVAAAKTGDPSQLVRRPLLPKVEDRPDA